MREIKSSLLLVGGFCLALLVLVIADQSFNYTLVKDSGCDAKNTPSIEVFERPEAITQSDYEWSEWGECSADCGRSFSTRQRRLRQEPDREILKKIFTEDELKDSQLLKDLNYELDSRSCMVKPCTYCLRPLHSNRNDIPPGSLFQHKRRIFKDLVPSTECRYPDYDPLKLPHDQVFIYVPMDDALDKTDAHGLDPLEAFNVSHGRKGTFTDNVGVSIPCPLDSPPQGQHEGEEEMSPPPVEHRLEDDVDEHDVFDEEVFDGEPDNEEDEYEEEMEEGYEDEDESYEDNEIDNILVDDGLHDDDDGHGQVLDIDYFRQVDNQNDRGTLEHTSESHSVESNAHDEIFDIQLSYSPSTDQEFHSEQAKDIGPLYPEKDTCANPERLKRLGRHYAEMCHPDEGNQTNRYPISFRLNQLSHLSIIIPVMIAMFIVLAASSCLNEPSCALGGIKESKEKVVSGMQTSSCNGYTIPITRKPRSRKTPVVTSELRRSPRRSSCCL